MKVLYFASLREQLGCGEEDLLLPEGVASAGALRQWLGRRGDLWSEVFSGERRLMCAVNQQMADDKVMLSDSDEVAFFPPVTGG